MDGVRHRVGEAALVRVPYADVLVDPEVVGLTAAQVAAHPWAVPTWAEGGRVRVAAAGWVIESLGRTIVVDPAQAADEILRSGPDAIAHQEAFAAALGAAGYPRESVDTVIATHIDGIGMLAWRTDDGWAPFFPNAELIVSERERSAIVDTPYETSGAGAFTALDAQGALTPVGDEHPVTSEVSTRVGGSHSPGHQVVDIRSNDDHATMIGHLALNPIHLLVDGCPLHVDVPGAMQEVRELADRRLLVGPLWPAPGAARWTGDTVEVAEPDPPS